jgi:hypothetical protein
MLQGLADSAALFVRNALVLDLPELLALSSAALKKMPIPDNLMGWVSFVLSPLLKAVRSFPSPPARLDIVCTLDRASLAVTSDQALSFARSSLITCLKFVEKTTRATWESMGG